MTSAGAIDPITRDIGMFGDVPMVASAGYLFWAGQAGLSRLSQSTPPAR